MFCFLLLPFFAPCASCTDYYVSRLAGNDAGPGLSENAPWKSVGRVNRASLYAGDRVLFHAGETWRETLRPNSSGAANAPIIFSGYGVGAKPVLDGSGEVGSGEDGACSEPTGRDGGRKGATWKNLKNNRPCGSREEKPVRDIAIDDNGQSHVVYDGIDLHHIFQGVRIYSWSATIQDITIQNCNIQTEASMRGREVSAGVYANVKRGGISGVHVRGNHFVPFPERLNHWGIYFVSGVSHFSIEDNTLGPSGEDGITIWHSAYGEIVRNRGGGDGENTIDVKDSHDVLIRDNDADLDREYNIVVHSVDDSKSTYNIRVEHNRCLRGGQGGELSAGIALLFVQKSSVEDNVVDFAYGSGILIKDNGAGQQNWVAGNRLTGNGTGQKLPAIKLQGDSSARLGANQIEPLPSR